MAIGSYRDVFGFKGFTPYITTQFLGALNDNFYKFIVAMLLLDVATSSEEMATNQSLVAFMFVVPFILFSGYAGYLADRFSKRSVLVIVKSFEIVVMGVALLAFLFVHPKYMIGILFLMALQSTFFSPAKYGIVPEMVPDKHLSRANGLLELTTFVAIIIGGALGGFMLDAYRDNLGIIGAFVLALAIIGTACSFGITRVPASGSDRPFRLNPWSEAWGGLKDLYRRPDLFVTVLGISYFWFLGVLFQMTKNLLGRDIMGLSNTEIGLLWSFLAIGIGTGSILAGRLSGDKVEQGLVPIGSIGMGVFSIVLSQATGSFAQAAAALTALGIFAGLFIVPLQALLQQKAGAREKGRFIAANNILNGVAMALAAGALFVMGTYLHMRADQILLVSGLATFAVTAYICIRIPDFLVRFTLWMLTHTFYRIRIIGAENIPARGPALIVCNHISHIDGLIVSSCIQRFIRALMYAPYYHVRGVTWLFKLMNVIPISAADGKGILRALEQAREELRAGHLVLIFAEGGVSRTGNMLAFKRGFEKIMEGVDVPIVPVHLDRLWGSIFSNKNGRFFWKWPSRIPYPVTVTFGAPMAATSQTHEVRAAIMHLGADAVAHRRSPNDLLHLAFIRSIKKSLFSLAMADSTGKHLAGWRVLAGAVALSRWVKRRCQNENMIGIMLPASVGGALANIAVTMQGKIPVNMNFTAGRESLDSVVLQCDIRTILTSRAFLDKGKIEEMSGMIYLEDVMGQIGRLDKLAGMAAALLAPAWLLEIIYHRRNASPDDVAAIIFSSGSTGEPKGVQLSHHSILSNVEAIAQVFWITEEDRIMAVLPFFHSFGFTATIWFPMTTGFPAIYHPNPSDAQTIGHMIHRYAATIFISTPTFIMNCIRKCTPEQFSSLRLTIVGAEKLRTSIATSFQEKFGMSLLEGYGCTEMALVVSANVPDVEDGVVHHRGTKTGTVGHPVPGVATMIVDRETGAGPLPPHQEGLLYVRGPSMMSGYLGQPEKTAEVIKAGWYVTGDIATIDEDGFITLVDRVSRFSKIAGEMVPHGKAEEAAQNCLGEIPCAVTGVSDERRGEKLVLLYASEEVTPEEVCRRLANCSLPKLWLPKLENVYQVPAIPVLGTGKLDLRKVKSLAEKLASATPPADSSSGGARP